MPMIARFFIGGRTTGNPFRMIMPTFRRLATNRDITRLAEREFGSARLHEFVLGGLVIVEAIRTTQSLREAPSSAVSLTMIPFMPLEGASVSRKNITS